MVKRCYSKYEQERCPTYKECTLDANWLVFSNFREWMVSQDWSDKEIDKDILIHGNKHYGPDTCVFVSKRVNRLLTDASTIRGKFPIGVSQHRKKYRAHISINNKMKQIGTFDTVDAAADAYRKAKSEYIKEIASSQLEPIKSALMRHALRIIKF